MRAPRPLILITTSRAPSPRTRSLVKDLELVLPRARRLTRGHLTMAELAAIARARGAVRVLVVGERRGNPSIIRAYKPTRPPLEPRLENIVTFIVRGASLSRERGARPGRGADSLLVEAGEGSEDVADAMVIAFGARLLMPGMRPGEGAVVASLTASGDEVLVEFRDWEGESVGPRLRLARPQRMVKGGSDA
ncbi:MAG: hypothetical protein LRS49_04085 [Desulfurococcales archaeon]|nr:hypothetical protein [Desulfurococcales archaeon]